MKRIVIIGSGGAGKTSLALDLGKKLRIPVHHLDAIFWRPGWKPVERREFEAAQQDLMGAPAWIIDGNYGGTMELRLAAADTIIFMDLPRVTCLFGALKRRIQQRSRPDKVVENRERLTLEYLLWIWKYRSTRRPGILKRLEDLRDEKTIIILRSRAETAAFLAAMEAPPLTGCPDRVKAILSSLQISPDSLAARSLVFHPEAPDLVVAETDESGKEHLLIPPAASAWRAMKASASVEGVAIKIVSAFRTIDRQAEIVRAKIEKGLSLESILCVSAPPGYSEHHSGRALDLTTDGVQPLEQEFEHTNAFRWLSTNAGRFGFTLSFPPNNRYGYAYEPWHWYFEAAEA